MGTYSKSVGTAGIGATADSFESIGSVEIPSYASHVHGFCISWAEATKTAAEAVLSQMRWSASDYSIGNQIINIAKKTAGGAPATNIQATGRGVYIKAIDLPVSGKGNIEFEASAHVPDPTGAFDIAVGVLYNDGISDQFKQHFPFARPGLGSDTEANAAITATTETAITDLDIQSWASEIVCLSFQIAPDAAITAGDPIVPQAIMRASFRSFLDQDYVLPSISTILGTPVGNSVEVEGIDYPVEIPVGTGSQETLTPNIKLTTTSATSIAIGAGVDWV